MASLFWKTKTKAAAATIDRPNDPGAIAASQAASHHAEVAKTKDQSLVKSNTDLESILSTEDELFLKRIASDAPLPPGGIPDAFEQDDNALSTPLPTSPERVSDKDAIRDTGKSSKKRWSFLPWGDKSAALANDPLEANKERRDINDILGSLNMEAMNNRVIGLSKDSQKLMGQFTLVLKDIVNGVPTAYGDLEKLLTEREKQIDKLYSALPPFLQSLVQTVPLKVYAALAPQVAAVIGRGGKSADSKDGKKKKKAGTIPSLKKLITEKGAVAAMLRSILGFLEARFPVLLTGTNVIMSLAVFILLFVFWYCHKRGREERLSKEEVERLGQEYSHDEAVADKLRTHDANELAQ